MASSGTKVRIKTTSTLLTESRSSLTLNQALETLNAESNIDNSSFSHNVTLQKISNPVDGNIIIRCRIPENSQKANLRIVDVMGNIMKQTDIISRGTSEISINDNEFSPGIYIYSLIIDGKLVDSKKMVITR